MITLGQIRDDIQADYFESFTDIKAIKRAIKRVFDKINLKLQGIDTLEEGLELIVASVTEDVTFTSAIPSITTTTDQSTNVVPGDVIVIYDSVYNSREFTIGLITATLIIPTYYDIVFEEAAVECTYAIYRPMRKSLVKDIVMTDLTYDNTAHTITSAGGELDFLELGVKAKDFIKITGATETLNNGFFEIASVTATVITIQRNGKSGQLTDDSNDPARITIYSPPNDKYLYDFENHKVTTAPSVKLLNGIISESTELKARSYPFIKDSGNDDAEAFSPVGRLEAMLADTVFVGAGAKLRFNVKRDLVPPVSSYPDTVIDVPQKYEGTLFWGVLRAIASLPRVYNKEIYDLAYEEYQIALAELDNSEPGINPPVEHKLKFHF